MLDPDTRIVSSLSHPVVVHAFSHISCQPHFKLLYQPAVACVGFTRSASEGKPTACLGPHRPTMLGMEGAHVIVHHNGASYGYFGPV